MADGWIILRTSGPRTLKLAASLNAAGVDAWTPIGTARRRARGQKNRRDVPAPITPTFVFARAHHLADLLRHAAVPARQHPDFSILHDRARVPVIHDASLVPLRQAEEGARLQQRKSAPRSARLGASVTLTSGAFAGMTGLVESSSEREAAVNFGGGFIVTIATYLLPEDVLSARTSADLSLAA